MSSLALLYLIFLLCNAAVTMSAPAAQGLPENKMSTCVLSSQRRTWARQVLNNGSYCDRHPASCKSQHLPPGTDHKGLKMCTLESSWLALLQASKGVQGVPHETAVEQTDICHPWTRKSAPVSGSSSPAFAVSSSEETEP